jgi:hypothetical protein
MKTRTKEPASPASEQIIKQMEAEIKALKKELSNRLHLTKSAEQDYDIKSRIIEKQNILIEMMRDKGANKKPLG